MTQPPGAGPSRPPISSQVWDVVVVGAGPAGATAARLVAARGRSVLLLDKREFPREKVCGDGLIADTLGALERAGLADEVRARARALHEVAVWSAGRIEVRFPGTFLTLDRRAFDDVLKRAAERAGATFVAAAVESVAVEGRLARLAVRGADGPVRARVAVLATGADVSLAATQGLVTQRAAHAAAVRCYVRADVALEHLVISYDRAVVPGYAWIFPLPQGTFNVGVGVFFGRRARPADVQLHALWRRFADEFPLARDLVRAARETTPLRGAALRCGLAGSVAHRGGPVIAVGETLGATFPFTGEGIGKAMETAELGAAAVLDALDADDTAPLAALPARIDGLAPRYAGYRVAQRWLSRPAISDLVARRALKSGTLRRNAAGILNETIDPREVFSVRGLWRSFWN